MKTHLIYKFTSPSGKSYIGQTCDLNQRKRSHKHGNGCIAFHNAIEKYGLENFIEEILEKDLTLEDANIFEEIYIAEHNTMVPNGYNLRTGGKHHKVSEESKQKNRESHLGKIVSEETRLKLSKAGMNRILSDEARLKITNSKLGKKRKPFTEDHKSKMGYVGENNPNYGKLGENNPNSKKIYNHFSRW